MANHLQELRYAWRQLRRAPGFTLLAVLSLALGIGLNTAMFAIVEGVLLRPLPYASSDQLVSVSASHAASSWLDYTDISNQSRTLASIAAYSNDVAVVQNDGASLSLVAAEVTPNLFPMLGVRPLKGRTFIPQEGETNGPRAVLISERLWREVLNGDPQVVGHTLRVNGRDSTIVGVMPKGLGFPESAGKNMEKGLWLPLQPTPEMLRERGYDSLSILGKLAPGRTVQMLRVELGVIAKRIRDGEPGSNGQLLFEAQTYQKTVTGSVGDVLLALTAGGALVLLIVCGNVAILNLARCLGRMHEFAVRSALGSGVWRLIRQMTVEAALLSLIGCLCGIVVAHAANYAVHALPPDLLPRAESIEVRWTALLASAGITAVSTVLWAVLPVIFIVRINPQAQLRAGIRTVSHRSFGTNVSGWLVGGEVALSLVLLVAAGLLFKSVWNLEHVRLGFDPGNVTEFAAMPADAAGFTNTNGEPTGPVAAPVYKPLLESMRYSAGFQDVALISAPPLSGLDFETSFRVTGWPRNIQQGFHARITASSGRYAELMGTPLVEGRTINDNDNARAPFVAVINRALAQKYFAGKTVLGQRLDLGGQNTGMVQPYTIVGVVGDQIADATSQPPQPLLMLSYQQIPPASLFYPALVKTAMYFVVKTKTAINLVPAAHAIVHRQAPNLALDHFQTMQGAVDQCNFGSRLGLYIVGGFAGIAVLMVFIGLYGVLSQLVRQRQREFGLRMALGATRQGIIQLVLFRGGVVIAVGLGGGIVLALCLTRVVEAFLYGVSPLNPLTLCVGVIALFLVGAVAASIPAYRAAGVAPVEALRDE